jgi:hypothetical protein
MRLPQKRSLGSFFTQFTCFPLVYRKNGAELTGREARSYAAHALEHGGGRVALEQRLHVRNFASVFVLWYTEGK